MIEQTHTKTHDTEAIARIVHETNRAYCVTLGDDSQKPWDDAPEWQRESAIAGVEAVIDGTARTPEQQHEAWCRMKREQGWVYGQFKDADLKTHPCLVPYSTLPPEQRRKDHLFRAVVQALTEDV